MAQVTVHASAVAFELEGRGPCAVVLSGPSGAGKSTLALELLALGARLVSDDQTHFHVAQGRLIATPPSAIAGLVEWRGVGLVPTTHLARAHVVAWAKLDEAAPRRLPGPLWHDMLGVRLPCLHIRGNGAAAAGVRQYILGEAWKTGCEGAT